MIAAIPPPLGKESYARNAQGFFKFFPFLSWFTRISLFMMVDLLVCSMAFKRKYTNLRTILEKDSMKHVTSVVPEKYHAMMTPKYPYGSKRCVGAPEWLETIMTPDLP
jgi:hypothetical protein